MKIYKIAAILLTCCFLAGCQSGTEKATDTKEQNEATQEGSTKEEKSEFPDTIQLDVSENVKVNAECFYPEDFVEGEGVKVIQSGNTLWNSREHIVEMFTKGQPIIDKETTDFDENYQTENYSLTETTGLYISTVNVLNYFSEQATYILNTIMDDERFSDYNGELYQKRKDLDFISQDEAWNQVKSFLNEMGVEVSNDYTCYVMDHVTMEQEENNIYQMYQADDVKSFEKKEQWTIDDDCYYFKTRLVWEGYPVIPQITGEGIDEENVTVIYDKTGIISLTVNGHCPLKKEKEISVQSPKKVAERLANVLKDIISETTYEVQQIELCQAVIGMDYETGVSEIVPVWKCSVLVKNGEDDPGYIKNYYYDAETLENIG